MAEFEPRPSGVGSGHSANCATTTDHRCIILINFGQVQLDCFTLIRNKYL